jgi:hypothetical protein
MSYESDKIKVYASSLAKVASLSNLFSESDTPYIHYRTTEYLYTRVFGADNMARSDISIDAKLGDVGVGIKTFVYSGRPKYEKIAEFNKELNTYSSLDNLSKIKRVAVLRNNRIEIAGNIAEVSSFIYHCIARMPGSLLVFEDTMPFIDIDSISLTSSSNTIIGFTDGRANYKFNTSKSTLFKEFFANMSLFEKPVFIHKDPFELLDSMLLQELPIVLGQNPEEVTTREFIVLPLYGYKGNEPFVFERSGLNQWNADGRVRDPNEVYIPIPVKVRNHYPGLLPNRDTPFDLYFPSGEIMTMKVSQDDGKAIMSQHNADLGQWLLRDILKIEEGTLVTYEMLEAVGIDSVEISRINGKYFIDFKKLGSYEDFIDEMNESPEL